MESPKSPGSRPSEPKRASDRALEKLVGKTLGRYQVLALLGEGAMATVMLGFDTTLRRRVALKILRKPPEGVESDIWREQFLREARAAAGLVHPHIVQIFDITEADGLTFFALEYLRYGSLRDLIKTGGPLPWMRVCELGAQAGDALAYAHDSGLIHRDIKPANLMMTERGHIKISDFGLVRVVRPGEKKDLPFQIIGTPMFMPPEVAAGQYSARSDLFSLAGSLWYALTGKPPYHLQSARDVLEVGLSIPLSPLSTPHRRIPQPLEKLLCRALDPFPAKRFARADTMADQLRDILSAGRRVDSRLAHDQAEQAEPDIPDSGPDRSDSADSVDLIQLAQVTRHQPARRPTSQHRKPGNRKGILFALLGVLALAAIGSVVILQMGEAGIDRPGETETPDTAPVNQVEPDGDGNDHSEPEDSAVRDEPDEAGTGVEQPEPGEASAGEG